MMMNPYKENPKLKLIPGRFYRDRDGTVVCCISVEDRKDCQSAVCAEVREHGREQRVDTYQDGMLWYDGQRRAPWIAEELPPPDLSGPIAPLWPVDRDKYLVHVENAFDKALEKHRKEIHAMMGSSTPTMNMISEAIFFLLAIAHAPGDINEDANDIVKRLEQAQENQADTLIALEKRAEKLEEFWPPGTRAGMAYRLDTVEKALILIQKQLESPRERSMNAGFDAVYERRVPTVARKIICLCGSTRFNDAFRKANLEETLKGNIVLTVGSMMHSDDDVLVCTICKMPANGNPDNFPLASPAGSHTCQMLPLTHPEHAETKKALDALHKKKIELADEVFVLNATACKWCKRPFETTGTGFLCPDRPGAKIPPAGPIPQEHQHEFEPYIGESTRSEIRHALEHGKPVRFLNDQLINLLLWEQIKPEGAPPGPPGRIAALKGFVPNPHGMSKGGSR